MLPGEADRPVSDLTTHQGVYQVWQDPQKTGDFGSFHAPTSFFCRNYLTIRRWRRGCEGAYDHNPGNHVIGIQFGHSVREGNFAGGSSRRLGDGLHRHKAASDIQVSFRAYGVTCTRDIEEGRILINADRAKCQSQDSMFQGTRPGQIPDKEQLTFN